LNLLHNSFQQEKSETLFEDDRFIVGKKMIKENKLTQALVKMNPEVAVEDEDKLWNSWSSNTVASILVDGQKLNDVFSQIKKQLEFLRQRQSGFSENLDQLTTFYSNGNNQSNSDFSNSNNLLKELKQEIFELRQEVNELRKQASQQQTMDQKIKALENWLQNQLKEHEKKTENLLVNITEQRSQSLSMNLQDLFEQLKKEQVEKHETLELSQLLLTKDFDNKLHNLKDILSVHELRAKNMEIKIGKNSQNIEEILEEIRQFSKKYLEPFQVSIDELIRDKAWRSEVETKADMTMLLLKADQHEMNQFQHILEEMQRRLISVLAETSDRVTAMDNKLDRRSDRIVQYCLKQLRKEFLHNNNSHNNESGGWGGPLDSQNNNNHHSHGTDIGKVRCLVCDHVSTQQREQDIVFSGPGLTHTLKTLQHNNNNNNNNHSTRPRSASPPPPTTTTNNNNNNSNNNHNYKSHLAKLTASPDRHSNNNNNMQFTDHLDDLHTNNNNNNGTKLPLMTITSTNNNNQSINNSKHSQSAPMIQIISHHVPPTTTLPSTTLPSTNTNTMIGGGDVAIMKHQQQQLLQHQQYSLPSTTNTPTPTNNNNHQYKDLEL
jgi:hypothetical protein